MSTRTYISRPCVALSLKLWKKKKENNFLLWQRWWPICFIRMVVGEPRGKRARFIRFAVERFACLCDDWVLVSRLTRPEYGQFCPSGKRKGNGIAERVIDFKKFNFCITLLLHAIACAKLGEIKQIPRLSTSATIGAMFKIFAKVGYSFCHYGKYSRKH